MTLPSAYHPSLFLGPWELELQQKKTGWNQGRGHEDEWQGQADHHQKEAWQRCQLEGRREQSQPGSKQQSPACKKYIPYTK